MEITFALSKFLLIHLLTFLAYFRLEILAFLNGPFFDFFSQLSQTAFLDLNMVNQIIFNFDVGISVISSFIIRCFRE